MSRTEAVDPRFVGIDSWATEGAVEAMLEGQLSAVASLKNQVEALSQASEAAARHLRAGGRLVYVGAGTSGRIAVQDGVELRPTFGWPENRLVFVVAGGIAALSASAEGSEDDGHAAIRQLLDQSVGPQDVVIGVAASGRTPFTVEAVRWAREHGALTIGIANNSGTELLDAAEFSVLADTGSELIAGSTRMKAGTAQKAALNIISTATMLRLGLVHQGLMVNMIISNDKLRLRANAMVESLARCEAGVAIDAIAAAGDDIRTAVLIARGLDSATARSLLARNDGDLRRAIDEMGGVSA